MLISSGRNFGKSGFSNIIRRQIISKWECFTWVDRTWILKNHLRRLWIFQFKKGGEISKFWEIQILEHNSAPNCSTVKYSYMRGLDMNTKKHFWRFWNFQFKRGKLLNFGKNQIFERISAPNYLSVTNYRMKRLGLNIENFFWILEFLILKEKTKFRKISIFEQ